jgi:hypothetical protein
VYKTVSRLSPSLFLAGFVLAAAAAGCEPYDNEESVQNALVGPQFSNRVVDVAYGQQRVIQTGRTCNRGNVCVHREPGPKGRCLRWELRDCATISGEWVTLHKNLNPAMGEDPFGAAGTVGQQYIGCGVQAAQNVLSYFGRDEELTTLRKYGPIRTHDWGSGKIASYPEELETDIRKMMTLWGGGVRFNVRRQSRTVPTYLIVKEALLRGEMIIALIENGKHWVVINGYRSGTDRPYHVIDYPHWSNGAAKTGEWMSEDQLDQDLRSWTGAGSDIVLGRLYGFEDHVYIFISRA